MANGSLSQNLLPLLFRRKAEADKRLAAEQAQQERITRLGDLYTEIQGADVPDPRAVAEATVLGGGVPSSLTERKTNFDFNTLADVLKVPKPVIDALNAGVLTPAQAIKLGAVTGEQPELTKENLGIIVDQLGLDLTADQLKSVIDLGQFLGKESAGQVFKKFLPADAGQSALAEKNQVIRSLSTTSTGEFIPWDELPPVNKVLLEANGVSINEYLGAQGIPPKYRIMAEKAVMQSFRESSIAAQFDQGGVILRWMTGETEDMPKGTLRFLEENFDKATGELKANVIQQKAEEMLGIDKKRLNISEVSPDIQPAVINLKDAGVTQNELLNSAWYNYMTKEQLDAILPYLEKE